jgi:hypothetical protein
MTRKPQTERQLGDRWARKIRAEGAYAVKLTAGSLTGIPDWLVMRRGRLELWEAKRLFIGLGRAYDPAQLRTAQSFFMRLLAKHAPKSGGVLLLGPEGYYHLSAREAESPLSLSDFRRLQEPYTNE